MLMRLDDIVSVLRFTIPPRPCLTLRQTLSVWLSCLFDSVREHVSCTMCFGVAFVPLILP